MTDNRRSGGRDGSGSRDKGGGRGGDRRPGRQDRGDRAFHRGDRRAEGRSGRDRRSQERTTSARDESGDTDERGAAPELPEDVAAAQLDVDVRRELATLPRTLAEVIARHLVMVGRLLEDDPDSAYRHATYARRKASRIGAVREASGVAAYRVGKWHEALSDLRAARRMTGRHNLAAVLADCERGLGRPERALQAVRDAEGAQLTAEDRVELRIIAAGARRDLGETQAALVELQVPELKERRARPWVARLFYTYADVLLELGRKSDAREYFARASAVDSDGVTDADERLAALEGLEVVDVGDDVIWIDAEESAEEPEDGS